MQDYPKVAIVYLSYHCEPYIDDVVSSFKKITYPKDSVELIIVDNPHPEHGPSMRHLEAQVMPLSEKELPKVTLLPQDKNLGFSGGNNAGIRYALDQGFDYIILHNNDGFFAATALEPLVEAMEEDKTIGAAQSLMLLHPETDFLNSAGNQFHYLGFGFCGDYRKKVSELDLPKVKDISYASGAAIIMRADLLEKYGLWDEDFFMYHEDLEYSFRLRISGYRIVLVRDSIFYHKYQFSRSIMKFYWMERNRYGVMLMFFRLPTLLLLLPMALVLEIGLWFFAFKSGWLSERIKVYKYWIKPSSWALWLKKRRYIQSIRTESDRSLLKDASRGINFQEKSMDNPILTYIGNPIMSAYYHVVMFFIRW